MSLQDVFGDIDIKVEKRQNLDSTRHEFEKMRSLNGPIPGHSSTSVLDRQISPIDDMDMSSSSPISPAPICRQFWKAGNYEDGLASKSSLQNSGTFLHIHPKFLHSNATSHKWAFGAIAELLDNAVDEIQNGATYVIVDKTSNPRDGRPALLIQDDGGGMDPEGMRRCLSFGFSDKKSKSAIGHYGNGFKTSSMRLGADVIVFSRHFGSKLTQSVGLLSYTFLKQSGYDRIVVPMVDYEFNSATGKLDIVDLYGKDHFMSNLSLLLQWSPYSTEAELLKQFDDIGHHGTKIVIYNLWFTEEGTMELDFDSDPEDIRLSGPSKVPDKYTNQADEQHMANQLRYSLRVYLSILYLRISESFAIILRGKVVLYHNIGSDLKHPEIIMYRPHSGGTVEGSVIITIGFLKEAPRVSIHGFNIYHKNRLILPFWDVVSRTHSKGRGVVGVLEANFIVPTHNKQDFEKTSVFQKLEARLKDMTVEYWQLHCGLLGYQVSKKPKATSAPAYSTSYHKGNQQNVVPNNHFSVPTSSKTVPLVSQLKRKEVNGVSEAEFVKRRASESVVTTAPINKSASTSGVLLEDEEMTNLMKENKKLREQLTEHEKNEKELDLKTTQLRRELESVEHEYARLLGELQLFDKPKNENFVR